MLCHSPATSFPTSNFTSCSCTRETISDKEALYRPTHGGSFASTPELIHRGGVEAPFTEAALNLTDNGWRGILIKRIWHRPRSLYEHKAVRFDLDTWTALVFHNTTAIHRSAPDCTLLLSCMNEVGRQLWNIESPSMKRYVPINRTPRPSTYHKHKWFAVPVLRKKLRIFRYSRYAYCSRFNAPTKVVL